MNQISNNQKSVKQALLDTISKIPEEKLQFIRGEIIITKNGETFLVGIRELLPPQKYNLKK
jgi:hypothetical protein